MARTGAVDRPLRAVGDDGSVTASSAERQIGGGNPLEHGWWAAILVIVGLLAGSGALSDNSFLTHLATGRLIRGGDVPHVDPYTFTAGGEPWVVQSWGASWIYATIEAAFGAFGIRLLVAGCTALLVGLVWRLTRPAEGLVGRLALVGVCVAASLGSWNERPQLLAFVAVALVALVVVEEHPAWMLAPIFAFWVNVHGSFPVGLAFLAAWAGALVVERRAVRAPDVAPLGWATIGAAAGAAVSPYGMDLLRFPVEMLGRGESLQYIREWKRPELLSPTFLALLALCGVAVWFLLRGGRVARAGIVVVLLGVSLTASRNVPTVALLVIPFAAPAFAGLGSLRIGHSPPRRRMAVVVGLVALAASVLMAVTPDYDLSPYPVAAVDRLEERGLVADGSTRIMSHDYVGNYLEWRYGDRANAWIDDRAEVLPAAAIEDYVFLLSGVGDWRSIVERHDPDLVLWRVDEDPVPAMGADAGYTEIHRDDEYVMFCRHAGAAPCR